MTRKSENSWSGPREVVPFTKDRYNELKIRYNEWKNR